MAKNDGGPAFPVAAYTLSTINEPMLMIKDGMSLRDYFAAAAMDGLVARIGTHNTSLIAHDAYIMADAMLAERNK